MNDELKELVCEALQDDCVGHCNYPYCLKVNTVVDNLMKHNVILAPCGIGDKVYFIGGIHDTFVNSATVTEITKGDCQIVLHLYSENGVYLDMPSDEVYYNKKDAEDYLKGTEHGKRL